MATSNPEFEIETEVDLDNIDTDAAEKLLARGNKPDEIEIVKESETKEVKETKEEKTKPVNLEVDPTPEELNAYSEQVRARIDKLTRQKYDERREKESALRERDEAIATAQRIYERARALEAQQEKSSDDALTHSIESITAQISLAKKEYIKAADEYDTSAMADAQEKLSELTAQKKQIEVWKAQKSLAPQTKPVVQPQSSARSTPDTRAQEWAARNSAWFQKDKAMTAFAFGVHDELVTTGIEPTRDPETYYRRLDEEIKARFPEKFGEASPRTDSPRQTSPVAPATRAANGRRKVTLTQRELALAAQLNVSPEEFAKEKLKLEKSSA